MNKYLEKSGLPIFDKDLLLLRILDGKENSLEERYQMLEQVGNFSSTPASLLRRILREQKIHTDSQKPKENNDTEFVPQKQETKEVIIGGEENIAFKVCGTCGKNGIPEHIVAHINSR